MTLTAMRDSWSGTGATTKSRQHGQQQFKHLPSVGAAIWGGGHECDQDSGEHPDQVESAEKLGQDDRHPAHASLPNGAAEEAYRSLRRWLGESSCDQEWLQSAPGNL